MTERTEKPKGRTMNEIIIDMDKGTGSGSQNQVGRILEQQTELMARRVQKSEMEQIMAESERKKIEEENRLKLARQGQMPVEPQLKEAPQEAKNILDAVKVGLEAGKPQQQPQGSVTDMAKSIVDAIKIGIDMGKAQTQQPQQQGYAEKYLDLLLGELKMARQEQSKDREARLEKEIAELKNRPGFMDELAGSAEKFATYKKMFGGGDTATANEYTLKKLEMEQTERLEDRKIGFEEKKWEYEKENEGKTMEQATNLIKTLGEGPLGKVLENIGSGVGERLKTGKNNAQQLIKIQCPNCGGQFSVNPSLQSVQCTHCGTTLLAKPPTTQEPTQPEPPQVTQEPPQQIDTQQTQTQESQQQESSPSAEPTDQPSAQ